MAAAGAWWQGELAVPGDKQRGGGGRARGEGHPRWGALSVRAWLRGIVNGVGGIVCARAFFLPFNFVPDYRNLGRRSFGLSIAVAPWYLLHGKELDWERAQASGGRAPVAKSFADLSGRLRRGPCAWPARASPHRIFHVVRSNLHGALQCVPGR